MYNRNFVLTRNTTNVSGLVQSSYSEFLGKIGKTKEIFVIIRVIIIIRVIKLLARIIDNFIGNSIQYMSNVYIIPIYL